MDRGWARGRKGSREERMGGGSGNICREYQEALKEKGFTPWAGEDAKWQPADIPDILLHETAVALVRKFLRQHPIKMGPDMDRNVQKLVDKLQEAEDLINEHYEVEDPKKTSNTQTTHTHTNKKGTSLRPPSRRVEGGPFLVSLKSS